MTESGRVVVAGAGLAGFRTVEELRERGFAGPITLVGAEPRPPYDRPPLSKKFLAEPDLDPSLKADFAALEVDFRPGEAATGLGDELITSRGAYPFDHLVLATGALPVALPGDGRQRFLRTYDDALALRDLLKPARDFGWPSWGPAGSAPNWPPRRPRTAARSPWWRPGPRRWPRRSVPRSERQTARWYAAAGVDLRVATAVEAVRPGGLDLAGGGRVEADEVVTAVGVRPAIGWLEGSGVRMENGVAVDAGLRTSRPRRLRGRGLRLVRVPPVRPPAAGGALGRGPAPARGGRGQRARRR